MSSSTWSQPTYCKLVVRQRKKEQHERVYHGTVVIHEGAEEVLVVADFRRSAHVGHLDCADTRFGGCPVYLYIVLGIEGMRLTAYSGQGHLQIWVWFGYLVDSRVS